MHGVIYNMKTEKGGANMKKVSSIFKDAVYDVATSEVAPVGCLHPIAKYDFIAYLDEVINYNVEKTSNCVLIINDDSFVIKFPETGNSIMFMNVIHPRYIDVVKYLLSENFSLRVIDNRKLFANCK